MDVDQDRLREELRRMRELIASDPEVFARFDTDGNGVIDGDEWNAVRELVIHRLRREAAEAELARELLNDLDPEQAAELARMEAEMSSDDPEEPATKGGPRDFSNLELAFDPREDRLSRQQSVAQEIYEREVVGRQAARLDHARGLRSDNDSLANCTELILEQAGGAKQLFGNWFKRSYTIRDGHNEIVGAIGQRENEALQNLTQITLINYPDLHFTVEDGLCQKRYEMRHSSGVGENSISVYNPSRREIARTSWTLSFLRRKYEVRCVRQRISYYVRRRLTNPWSYDVLNPFEEKIGEMQRGWSGLGFLTMGNLFHIQLDEEVPVEAMWGFLATALLADLDSESNSRRSFLDVFNG